MFRHILGLAVLGGALLASSQSFAQGACTRAELQAATDSYIAAQEKGDPSLMALAAPVAYSEQRKPADIKTGVLSTPQTIDFHHSLLDVDTCQTFTEVIITDPKHPYVLGTRLKVDGGKVSEIETLVTDEGDWLFSPTHTLKWQRVEDWGVLPPAERSDRATLIAAANAYFDLFMDKSVKVPWGTPCDRLEGGLYTGNGGPNDSCNVGVPSGVKLVDRRFIVDPDIGAVVGLISFGAANGLPDSHLFRVVNGKIRYVHTITVCSTPNCGFPIPAQLKEAP
ncbi:MAG: hypothetical protein WDM92_09925 [Caulobacteraceae bacterium]